MKAQTTLLRRWNLYQWPLNVIQQVSTVDNHDGLELLYTLECLLDCITFNVLMFQKLKIIFLYIHIYFADNPASLVSSDRSVSEPVEASIEDLHDIHYEPSRESVQTDARAVSTPSPLEEKLDRELQYHKHGSYNHENQPDSASCHLRSNSNPFLQHVVSDHIIRQAEQDRPSCVSSVHSWTKEPVQPTSQEEARYHTPDLYESMNSPTPIPSHLPMSASTSSLPQFNQQHPQSHYGRQQSWPTYPVSETSAPEISPGHLLAPSKSSLPQDPGTHICLWCLQLLLSTLTDIYIMLSCLPCACFQLPFTFRMPVGSRLEATTWWVLEDTTPHIVYCLNPVTARLTLPSEKAL